MILDPEEVRVLVDDFDDVNHELVEIKKIMDETEEETFANLSASESAMLNKIISKINKNIKNF